MRKALETTKSFVCLICLITPSLICSATNYYSVNSGTWNSNGVWLNNVIPPYTISNETDTVFINSGHTIAISQDVHLYGVIVINNASIVEDNGKKDVIVESTGKLIVIGAVEIQNLSNEGVISLEGEITINGSTENTGTIEIAEGGSFGSSGDFTNSGEISNSGDLTISGSLTNTGAIENNGIIEVGEDFENNSSDTLNNYGDIVVQGSFTNTGPVNNEGSIVDSGGLVLSIRLLGVSATPFGPNVRLSWSTTGEINNDFFTLEKSSDDIVYNHVANIKGAGNSNQILHYSYTDVLSNSDETIYYSLKQTDFNGQSTLISKLFIQSGNKHRKFSIPTVCNCGDNIDLHLPYLSDWEVVLYDLNARLRLRTRFVSNHGCLSLNTLTDGVYLLRVTNRSDLFVSKLILK